MGNIEHPWWMTERVGDEPLMPEPSRPCAGWIERTRKAEAEVESLRDQLRGAVDALKAIRDELGVPGPGYPAPVANAAKIAADAIAAAGGQYETE